MNVTTTENGDISVAPEILHPYDDRRDCPSCGFRSPTKLDDWLRKLWGEQPLAHADLRFCPGGKAPIDEVAADPLSMMMGKATHEIRHICAGINHPHLHVRCARCQAGYLMETKQGGANGAA